MLKLSESKICYTRKLSPKVLCVASVNPHIGDRSAYVGAISEESTEEIRRIADWGTKLRYSLAKGLFPTLDQKYTWRD